MKKIISILAFLLFTQNALAHQPRIVDKEMTIVENPEISQAFYGELNGAPEYYEITSDKEFELYLGVLVPDIEGVDKDISFTVYKDDEALWDFDGLSHEWTYFWEEFGGDGYYDGPELRSNPKEEYPKGVMADSGTYKVKVFSPDNEGKYVLAVGTIESFPPKEILNTIKTLPILKSDFFGKSALSAFNNKIGMFIFGPVIILIITAGIVIYLIRRHKKIKPMKKLIPIIIIIAASIAMFFVFKPEAKAPITDLKNNSNAMNITSPIFKENENMPPLYTCDSKNINPPLQIWNAPEGTKSFALILDDPDAVMAGSAWVHWIMWNIPADTKSIGEDSVPGVQGKTDFGKAGYGGPCPPTGTHRYSFRVYALDTMLELPEGAMITDLIPAMQGHILDQSELVGLYSHS